MITSLVLNVTSFIPSSLLHGLGDFSTIGDLICFKNSGSDGMMPFRDSSLFCVLRSLIAALLRSTNEICVLYFCCGGSTVIVDF